MLFMRGPYVFASRTGQTPREIRACTKRGQIYYSSRTHLLVKGTENVGGYRRCKEKEGKERERERETSIRKCIQKHLV